MTTWASEKHHPSEARWKPGHLALVGDEVISSLATLENLRAEYDLDAFVALGAFVAHYPELPDVLFDLAGCIREIFGVAARLTLGVFEDDEAESEPLTLRVGIDYSGSPEKVAHLLGVIDEYWDAALAPATTAPILVNLNY